MKKAVLLHGTDGTPQGVWFPWLKEKLELAGYEVWVPQLPECHTPNREVYNDFVFGQGWDFTDNVVIGHSSGAVSVLNLLMDERCPPIKLGAMIGAWAGGPPTNFDGPADKFDGLWPTDGFDFAAIHKKADKLVFLHGDDDPYCPLEQAQFLAKNLDAPITVISGGGHFSQDKQRTDLPELWQILTPYIAQKG